MGLTPDHIGKDGKRFYASTSLLYNFSKPTENKPALLKHHEVVTMFHEMGHGIHNLVCRTKYLRTFVEWDFVEAPSQMLEFWPWDKGQLKIISSHFETKKSLTDELIDSLVKSKNVLGGITNMRGILLAKFDLSIHQSKDGEIDLDNLFNTLQKELSIGALDDFKSHEFSTMNHLMSGYDSGFYGYLWSQAFATDMYYSKFEADSRNSDVSEEYKTKILAPGGSRDAMESLKDFLGREPNNNAFLQELGVSDSVTGY